MILSVTDVPELPDETVAAGAELEDWRPVRIYWAGLEPDQIVGFAGEGRCCPLARWLRDALRAPNPWVGDVGYALCMPLYLSVPIQTLAAERIADMVRLWGEAARDRTLPEWAAQFIMVTDGLIPMKAKAKRTPVPITAALAVELLDVAVRTTTLREPELVGVR